MRHSIQIALALTFMGCHAPEARKGPQLSVSGPPERLQAFEQAARACGLTDITRETTNGVATVSARAPASGTAEYQCGIRWLSAHPETFVANPSGPVAPTIATPEH